MSHRVAVLHGVRRTGKTTLKLFPLAQMEIGQTEQRHQTDANLENRLIYGAYPEVVPSPSAIR